ncbi:MAG: IS3 family transposase, partial [Bacilli bacterium]
MHAEVKEKVKFIDDNKVSYDVRTLCRIIHLHHSIYYYHINHQSNSYADSNEVLDKEIKRIFEESKKRYGSPKITKALNNQDYKISQKRVARRMKILGLRSITVKKFNHSGNSKADNSKEYPNLLNQNFKAEKPGEKWLGDITYIYTKERGWTYLAIVIDLFDLKVIGWEYGLNMTEDISIKALKKAFI